MLVVFSIVSLGANLHSHAAPLYFTSTNGLADLSGSPLDVTYNSSGGSFQVNGDLSDFIDSSGNDTGSFSGYGGYSISATINSGGVLASGGTVSISGSLGPDYVYSGPLLTGTLESGASGTAWGYYNNNSIDQFTFLFNVTGGDVASDFGGIGALCGVSLFANFEGTQAHGDTPFTGTWGGSFSNLATSGQYTGPGSGQGSADIFPVPEPSSILLTSVGVALCMAARRRLNVPRA